MWLSATVGFAGTTTIAADPGFPHTTASAPAMPVADTGYWTVSTYESSQSFDRDRPRFLPRVTRARSGGLGQRVCFAELCRSLVPGVPICIYVHGSFVSPEEIGRQAEMTNRWLRSASCGQPLQVIDFVWPSYRPIIVPTVKLDVILLGRRAARNGWYLAELIRYLPPECPICLIGHSHGTRVIASALHLMGGGEVQGVAHPHARPHGRLIRAVFAASAVSHDWLNPGERYGRAPCAVSSLINLKNRHDAALLLYPLRRPFSGLSLGTVGFTRRDRDLIGRRSSKLLDCDVTELVKCGHLWPRYLRHRSLAWLIRNYVYFPDVRQSHLVSSTEPAAGQTSVRRDEGNESAGAAGKNFAPRFVPGLR